MRPGHVACRRLQQQNVPGSESRYPRVRERSDRLVSSLPRRLACACCFFLSALPVPFRMRARCRCRSACHCKERFCSPLHPLAGASPLCAHRALASRPPLRMLSRCGQWWTAGHDALDSRISRNEGTLHSQLTCSQPCSLVNVARCNRIQTSSLVSLLSFFSVGFTPCAAPRTRNPHSRAKQRVKISKRETERSRSCKVSPSTNAQKRQPAPGEHVEHCAT